MNALCEIIVYTSCVALIGSIWKKPSHNCKQMVSRPYASSDDISNHSFSETDDHNFWIRIWMADNLYVFEYARLDLMNW